LSREKRFIQEMTFKITQ